MRGARGVGLLVLAVAGLAATGAKPAADPSASLFTRYARLLVLHRPDLAARWGASDRSVAAFEPLTESTLARHLASLEALRREAESLPATARADTLRARLALEIGQSAAGGALRTDAFLWLDIVEAATRAPFAADGAGGCRQIQRATLQLRRVPEALRSGAVLMRGAPGPEPAAFERRLTELEHWFRRELPERTKPCREARRLAEFVEADTLAAASLRDFRHRVLPAP